MKALPQLPAVTSGRFVPPRTSVVCRGVVGALGRKTLRKPRRVVALVLRFCRVFFFLVLLFFFFLLLCLPWVMWEFMFWGG